MMNTPSFRLDGKVAMITGASSGIGARLAQSFAAAGAAVALVARRRDRLEALEQELLASGAQVVVVELDINEIGRAHV